MKCLDESYRTCQMPPRPKLCWKVNGELMKPRRIDPYNVIFIHYKQIRILFKWQNIV